MQHFGSLSVDVCVRARVCVVLELMRCGLWKNRDLIKTGSRQWTLTIENVMLRKFGDMIGWYCVHISQIRRKRFVEEHIVCANYCCCCSGDLSWDRVIMNQIRHYQQPNEPNKKTKVMNIKYAEQKTPNHWPPLWSGDKSDRFENNNIHSKSRKHKFLTHTHEKILFFVSSLDRLNSVGFWFGLLSLLSHHSNTSSIATVPSIKAPCVICQNSKSTNAEKSRNRQ